MHNSRIGFCSVWYSGATYICDSPCEILLSECSTFLVSGQHTHKWLPICGNVRELYGKIGPLEWLSRPSPLVITGSLIATWRPRYFSSYTSFECRHDKWICGNYISQSQLTPTFYTSYTENRKQNSVYEAWQTLALTQPPKQILVNCSGIYESRPRGSYTK